MNSSAIELIKAYDDLKEIVGKLERKSSILDGYYQHQMSQKNHAMVATTNAQWQEVLALLKQARSEAQAAKIPAQAAFDALSDDERTEVLRAVRMTHTPADGQRRNALHDKYNVSTYPH